MTEQDTQLPGLPNGWVWTKIGEIALSLRDGTHTPPARIVQGIPLLSARNVKEGYIDWEEDFSFISSDDFDKIRLNNPIRENDILLTIVGTLGRACVVKTIKPFTLQRSVAIIRVDNQLLSPSFIQHVFNSPSFRKLLTDSAKGTAQQGIYLGTLGTLPLPLPPLSEQHRIVTKIEELFTRLDDGVAELKKVQLQLKRYRQSVLKSAFNGELTAEWREEHKGELAPESVLLEKIKAERKKSGKYKELVPLDTTDLLELPEGWIWTNVGNLAESMKNGIYKPPQYYGVEGVACLRMYNIEDGSIVWKDIKRMNLTPEEVRDYGLATDDILVNRVNSRELVGKSASIPSGLEFCVFESKNIRLRIYQRYIVSKYVSYWMRISAQSYFNRNAQQTVGMASINQEQLGAMPIPLCGLSEQRKIVEEIERCFSVADEIEATTEESLKQSERLRQSILKKAFEGKLVSQDPEDEPADKLLERIKPEKIKTQANTKRGRAIHE